MARLYLIYHDLLLMKILKSVSLLLGMLGVDFPTDAHSYFLILILTKFALKDNSNWDTSGIRSELSLYD